MILKNKKKAFTIIELIVIITIIGLLSTVGYLNYKMYQDSLDFKLGIKEISQNINEAKNLARNGYEKNNKNQSIGILFDTKNNDVLKFYSFDYDIPYKSLKLDDENFIKDFRIKKGVKIKNLGGNENIMIYFASIIGDSELIKFNPNPEEIKQDDFFKINISLNNSKLSMFNKEITYFKNTNIIDY